MRVLALDLSKTSTGWATCAPGDRIPASGYAVLGSEWSSRGRVFAKLHMVLTELRQVHGHFDAIFYEEPLPAAALQGFTNIETLRLAAGLAAHTESWAEAMGVRVVREANMASWRRHFIGKMPRATKTAQLKDKAMERCRELGFRPRRHDEAEAIGILSYACDALDLSPEWDRAGSLQLVRAG
jgi:hypothetical protein